MYFTLLVAVKRELIIIFYTDVKNAWCHESTSPYYFSSNGLFSSNHAGIIRTALANMDREAREHYTVVIQAKDMAGQVGGLSGSTTINITLTDINDNPPKFPQSKYTTLHENNSPAKKIQTSSLYILKIHYISGTGRY